MADLFGVSASNLLVTRGSSEAIDTLIRAWCRAYVHSIVTAAPTFDMYRVYADIQGAEVRAIPLEAERDFALDTSAMLDACDESTRILFLCSPNNPTGTLVPRDDILRIVESLEDRVLLVADEAYIEFSNGATLAPLVTKYRNLVVLRTLSKAHALAGARCGAAIACEDVIDVMSRVLPPYSFATPVVDLVRDTLSAKRIGESRNMQHALIEERERLFELLNEQNCIDKVWPSEGNFLFARFKDLAAAQKCLFEHRILIRDFSSYPGLENHARITVGSRTENDVLVRALRQIAGER